ncbi:MAG: hypothetical protein J6T10_01345 [Methanobrevibacter sp.]|nr:hypothetical protein [Methanobrevibacter sp.]
MLKFSKEELEKICQKYDIRFVDCNQNHEPYDYRLYIRGDGFFRDGAWRWLLGTGSWNAFATFKYKEDSFELYEISNYYEINDDGYYYKLSKYIKPTFLFKSSFYKWLETFLNEINIARKQVLIDRKIQNLQGDFE